MSRFSSLCGLGWLHGLCRLDRLLGLDWLSVRSRLDRLGIPGAQLLLALGFLTLGALLTLELGLLLTLELLLTQLFQLLAVLFGIGEQVTRTGLNRRSRLDNQRKLLDRMLLGELTLLGCRHHGIRQHSRSKRLRPHLNGGFNSRSWLGRPDSLGRLG